MVALVIASLLLVGLTTLFVNNTSARNELEKSSRQIENGRYAMQILADDIRHAGYYGALITQPLLPGSVTSLPDACSTTTSVVRDAMGLPLQGYAGASTASGIDSGKLACLDGAAGYKPLTAVLVVRRAHTTIAGNSATAGQFNIQVSGCAGDTQPYILDTSSGTFSLHSNGSPGCTPLSAAPAAKISPYITRIYFISTCSGTDCTASGADSVPTLKRIDITPTSTDITPLVDGIENMQFDYGIDASPFDGVPDVYTNTDAHSDVVPSSLGEWANVMAVRVYLLARNTEPTGGAYTDVKTYELGPVSFNPGGAYRRHAYSEAVRLVNPSGRRE